MTWQFMLVDWPKGRRLKIDTWKYYQSEMYSFQSHFHNSWIYKFLRFSILFLPLYIKSRCYGITQLSSIALVLIRMGIFHTKAQSCALDTWGQLHWTITAYCDLNRNQSHWTFYGIRLFADNSFSLQVLFGIFSSTGSSESEFGRPELALNSIKMVSRNAKRIICPGCSKRKSTKGFTWIPLILTSARILYLSRNLTFNNANRNNLKFSLNVRETS